MEAEDLQSSLVAFVEAAWHIVDSHEFILEPHIEAICEHLEAVTRGEIRTLIVNIPPRHSKPVHEEEPVSTDRGWVPLREIKVGDLAVTHRGRLRRVLAVHEQGVIPTVTVRTKKGRALRMAPDHPVLTARGWVEAGHLTSSDVLAIVTPESPIGSHDITPEEARLLGYLVGDGSCQEDQQPSVTCADDREIADIASCAATLGFGWRVSRHKGRGLASRVTLLGGRPSVVRAWMAKHGVLGKNSYTKLVPPAVMEGSDDIIANFLGAYWACDGHFSTRGHGRNDVHIGADSVHRALLEQIQHLLNRLGIVATLRRKVMRKPTAAQGAEYVSHALSISSTDDAGRFAAAIPVHNAKAAMLSTYGRCDFDRTLRPDPVVAVEPSEPAACRCLTVADDESFTVRDIAVHNSKIIGVLWPAWCWLQQPGLQFLSAARSKGLASRDAVASRQLILSRWFRQRWPRRRLDDGTEQGFSLLRAQNTMMRYVNDRGGHRVATAVGQGTGDGGDIVVIDDPTTAEQALSDAERGRANRWLDNTISSRFNDPKTGRLVLVMQRLHGDDMTAHILREAESDVVHLRLPAEFEPSDRCTTVVLPSSRGKPWRDWRRAKGELLAPIRFPQAELDRLKRRLRTPYNIAGQLQQRPTSLGGEILKSQWWVVWIGDKPPESSLTIASIDTAMSKEDQAAGSACTVWRVYVDTQDGGPPQTMVLLSAAWREQLSFNELVEKIDWTVRRYRAERCLVEMKANGISVVQELRRRFRWAEQGIEQINPSIDKVARANSVAGLFQAGYVSAPKLYRRDTDGKPLLGLDGEPLTYTPDWAQMVIDECAEFPRGRYADLTDTTTQAISWLRRRSIVFFREDDDPPARHLPAPTEGHY